MTMTTLPDWDRADTEPGRSQIPHGVQDRFLEEAARRRQAEASLRLCAAGWGYQEVIPPSFEYYDNLSVGASDHLRRSMYRFFDRQGRTLALRADFTPQLARMAATKLFDRPMPLRFFYVGSLFRWEEPQAGRKREFTQAGMELIGVDSAAADAEVVALSIAAMEALGLEGFQINLGQMAFFKALTAAMDPGVLAPIRDAIDQKSGVRLEQSLDAAGVGGALGDILLQLPALMGGPEVLDTARTLAADLEGARQALDRLVRVYDLLVAYGVAGRVKVDLGEVRGMDYYTGITFRGVAPRLGWAVVSGGRYDNLIANFGRPLPAVGFGLGIERALLIQSREIGALPHTQVLVQSCDHKACLALVQRLRAQDIRVEIDVQSLAAQGLEEQARLREIPRILCCSADSWLLIEDGSQRPLTEDDIIMEAARWL
jgi:ATP phosphoribosyltransferase regulatory subunit